MQAPSWHGFFVFKVEPGCNGCGTALSILEQASRETYQDHDLRICASFTVIESLGSGSSLPREQAPNAAHPVLYWIPPAHEQHADHLAPTVRLAWMETFETNMSNSVLHVPSPLHTPTHAHLNSPISTTCKYTFEVSSTGYGITAVLAFV